MEVGWVKNTSPNKYIYVLFIQICSLWLAAAAAAKSLQSCPTLCDPVDAAHQAPLSLGFSRQEYYSGLPFPSLIHESESEVVSDS